MEEIKNICAREFIFFQVQEKGNEKHYQEDLTKFIEIFKRDMEQRIKAKEGNTSKIREDE
ncbi:MAG: hypothetical protein EPO11_01245 [Gammaproteobacteria bacterium]|nr:MAG: hypothetical protein EPO11_01245 [Gammaproteobacteria bacterium]